MVGSAFLSTDFLRRLTAKVKSAGAWSMIKTKKSTFTTDEHEDFVQERSASILKDHVTLFTYTKGGGRNPDTVKKEALKELTAHCTSGSISATQARLD